MIAVEGTYLLKSAFLKLLLLSSYPFLGFLIEVYKYQIKQNTSKKKTQSESLSLPVSQIKTIMKR